MSTTDPPPQKVLTVTVEQLSQAFMVLDFTDRNEWHWKKFIETLLKKERLERKE